MRRTTLAGAQILVALAWAACGGESTASVPEPPTAAPGPAAQPSPSLAPAAPGEGAAPAAPGEGAAPAADVHGPAITDSLEVDEQFGETLEAAVEPVGDTIDVLAQVTRGSTHYVLYTRDRLHFARERLQALEPREQIDLLDDALEACDAQDDYSRFSCLLGVAPDMYLVAAAVCEAREWGVATVMARDDGFVRTARRTLYALGCLPGDAPDSAATLRARDLDGDGREELTVRFAISLLRDDLGMNGGTGGTLTFVLDESLRTQLRVSAEYESMVADVAGTTTTCQANYRLADTNGDGRDDATVRARCTADYQDEVSGDSSSRPSAQTLVCPYDVARDAWICERDIADWLFTSSDGALALERVEQLAVTGLGAQWPRVREEARARAAAAETGSAAAPVATPAAVSAARTCVHVVQDPAPPLRVRSAASARSDAVGELANGVELTLLDRRGSWGRIEAPVAGWVYTQNLRERCGP